MLEFCDLLSEDLLPLGVKVGYYDSKAGYWSNSWVYKFRDWPSWISSLISKLLLFMSDFDWFSLSGEFSMRIVWSLASSYSAFSLDLASSIMHSNFRLS